jgi:type VI secretion system Hcp family effector
VPRSRTTSRTDRRARDRNGAPQLFALQSAIGNRASAALMREAATTSSSTTPAVRRGQKHAYITIEGEKQGKFKGSSQIKGREDAIEISSYRLGVSAPRDVGTGQSTGKRQYQAISFKKAVDASSPQFMKALTENETLKKVVISFYGPDDGGKERVYQTVTLENASLKSWVQDFENEDRGGDDLEIVELVFEKIELESNTGGTTAQDSWGAPGK